MSQLVRDTFGFLLLLFSTHTYAVTKTSVATGNWSDSAIWSPGGVPASGDDVVIHGGNVVTIDSVFTCRNLDVSDATSGTTTLKIITAGCGMTITGDLRINPNNRASTIVLDAGPGVVNVSGTFSTWGTAGTNSFRIGLGGVLTFAPAVTISASTQYITFYAAGTVNFNSSFTDNYNRLTTYAACIVNFKSSYTVNTTSASWAAKGTAYFSSTGSITPNTNLTLYAVVFNSTARTTLNDSAGTVIIGGLVTLSSGAVFTCRKDIEVNGAWTNNGGTFSATGKTVTFNTGVIISGSAATTFPNIKIGQESSAATKAITMNNNNSCTGLSFSSAARARTLTISTGVTLTINGDLTINQNTGNYPNTLSVNAGNCLVSGNLIFTGTDNTASQYGKIGITSGAFTLNGNVTWMNNTAVVTEVITVSTGSLIFNSSVTMGDGTGTVSVTGAGVVNFNGTTAPSFTFGGASTAPVFTTAAGSTINFAKGFTNNTNTLTFYSTSTVVFTGNGAITPNANITFGKVTLNTNDTLNAGAGYVKVAGVFTLASGSSFITNKSFELTGNWVNNGGTLDAANDTIFLNGTAQTISGTSSTSFTTLQMGTASAITVVCTMNNSNTCTNLTFSTFTKGRTLSLGTGSILTINGDLNMNQATAAVTNYLNINTGTCILNGNLIFTGTVNTTTYACKVAVTTGSFTLNGDITWMSNTVVATEVISVTTGTLTFANSLTMGQGSGTITVSGAATVNFNGTSAPSLNFGGAVTSPIFTTAANCTINFYAGFTNNSVAFTFKYPSTVAFTGNGTVTSNAAITFSSIQINSGATMTLGGNIYIKGNWTDLGTFVPSTYITNFNAVSPNIQTISRVGGETFSSLTASVTGATLFLANNIMVTSLFTMGGHGINLNGNTLTLGDNASASLTRTAGIAYGGTWKRWFPASAITSSSGAYLGLFPIGTSTDYRPIAINTTVSPTTAGYVMATHVSATSITLVTYTDNEGHNIQDISDMNSTLSTSDLAGGTYKIDMYFTGFMNAGVTTDLKLETYTGATMGSAGTSAATTGTVINPTVKRTLLTVADLNNVWVIGSKNLASTPLRQFYFSRKTGNWNDVTIGAGTWSYTPGGAGASCDCTPSGTGYAIINSGHTVTITSNASIDYIEINSGGTLKDNGTATLTVNRDIRLSGTGTFNNSSSWTITGGMYLDSTSATTSTGTITINGDLNIPAAAIYTQTSGTLNLVGDGMIDGTIVVSTATVSLSGSSTVLSGNGAFISTGTSTFNMSNNREISVGSNLTIGSAATPVTFAITGAKTMTNYGTVKIYGNLTGTVAGSTWLNAANSSLEVTGSLLTTGTLNVSSSPNTVKYSGTGSQTIKAPASTYYRLVTSNSGTKSLPANIAIDDAVTIQDSSILDMITYVLTGSADLNMTGNSELKLQRSTNGTYPGLTGDFNLSGGTVTINQTANTATLAPARYHHVKFTGSRPYDISGVANIDGNFTVQGSSTLINNMELTVGGIFTYASSATTTLNDDLHTGGITLSAGTLADGGNTISITDTAGWENNGGTYSTTGLAIFSGLVPQKIKGNTSTTFNALEINNPSGVTLSLSGSASAIVSDALILAKGLLTTTTEQKLIMLNGSTASGGSDIAYINGPMVKVGNDDFVFPIGGGGRWRRVGISEISDSLTEVTAEYFPRAYSNLTPIVPPLYNISDREYWNVSREISSDSIKLTLFWEDVIQSDGWECDHITVAHWKDNQWIDEPAKVVSGSSCNLGGKGSIQTIGYVNSFSPFTLGGYTLHALPIELVSFNAMPQNNFVQAKWTTALEINNDYFTLERSEDAVHFEEAGQVEGAGNSTTEIAYEFTDEHPFYGTSYYRLKQTDFDGQYTYSNIVSVTMKNESRFTLYPNPTQGDIYLGITHPSDKINVQIYDLNGQKVMSEIFDGETETSVQTLSIHVNHLLPPGIYFVKISTGDSNATEKMIVQ
ncbi:MAG: T9SS type A sorting domain-containing protein [Bacteroidetes bacterium]|nr:T9SS type A sorting domain-containing protein [Bacteroidota bacterium]